MIKGVSSSQLKILKVILSTHLKPINAKVFLFGSRVDGNPRESSDLDVWIEVSGPVPLALIGQLKANLEESDLPFKVDLLFSSQVPSTISKSILSQKLHPMAL